MDFGGHGCGQGARSESWRAGGLKVDAWATCLTCWLHVKLCAAASCAARVLKS